MAVTTKNEIEQKLSAMQEENKQLISKLHDRASLLDYRSFIKEGKQKGETVSVWTEALQKALDEHEIITIPASDTPYYIDNTITIPSNRRIEADENATICLMEGVRVLMLRNVHTADGTHAPIRGVEKDDNISIIGGCWKESHNKHAGCGLSGLYDEERSFYGVSTCMLFNNMEHLTIQNAVFSHCASFAVQTGDIKNVDFQNITFDSCFGDGLHINGNTENVLMRNIHGQVGDDLVALNLFDWQTSSVDFGPAKTILAEDLVLSEDSLYKAIRILPAIYRYDDGSTVDCSLNDVIFRRVKGIEVFKLYHQTPPFLIGKEDPEPAEIGNGSNLYFEDIDIDLSYPVDRLSAYMNSDPVRGHFAVFEFGANISNVCMENIRLTLHRDQFPFSHLICVGPKSIVTPEYVEIFDPDVCCKIDDITLSDIFVNGKKITEVGDLVYVTVFDHLYPEIPSSGKGEIGKITLLK